MFTQLGAHVVGMTGYPEVALAREAGLRYASIAVVSNFADFWSLFWTSLLLRMTNPGPPNFRKAGPLNDDRVARIVRSAAFGDTHVSFVPGFLFAVLDCRS